MMPNLPTIHRNNTGPQKQRWQSSARCFKKELNSYMLKLHIVVFWTKFCFHIINVVLVEHMISVNNN